MKLRNKKTREIGELQITERHCAVSVGNGTESCGIEIYSSLDKLNEEWEDYEEPTKEYWYIENNGDIDKETYDGDEYEEKMIAIGNYFETKEEAEKAVEKLKAWKRLKDKGFKFDNFVRDAIYFNLDEEQIQNKSILKDLDLLFGGEE